MSLSQGRRLSLGDILNVSALLLACTACVAPFVYILAVSLTSPDVYVPFELYLIPKKFSLASYRYILSTKSFVNAIGNTGFVTIIGTLLCLVTTFSTAYGLTKKTLPGRRFFMGLIIFVLIFNAGIVPSYINVKNLHLLNSLWALVCVSLTSAWNLIVVRNFMQSLPAEIEESAKIDGYNDLSIFIRIIIPLSLPSIAAFTLFFAVMHWNTYFHALMYLTDSAKWTLQLLIKTIVVDSSSLGVGASGGETAMLPQEPIRLASVMLSVLPVLILYPFLQKYFVKGVMIGAVKG